MIMHPMWVIGIPMRAIGTPMWVIVTPTWVIDTLYGLSSLLCGLSCGLLVPSYGLRLLDRLSTFDLRSSNIVVYDKHVMVYDNVDYNKIIDDKSDETIDVRNYH